MDCSEQTSPLFKQASPEGRGERGAKETWQRPAFTVFRSFSAILYRLAHTPQRSETFYNQDHN